jgi:hypothetical protein
MNPRSPDQIPSNEFNLPQNLMIEIFKTRDLPNTPAVYAMFGGQTRSRYVAYVGIGTKLRGRVEQHLVRRDSSVTTGVSAVSLNPDHVTEVRWWEQSDFDKQEVLEAAELVAFDVLEPALRSRGGITDRARQLYAAEEFRAKMRRIFEGAPSGKLVVRGLADAWRRIDDIEGRLKTLEDRLTGSEKE